MVGNYQLKNELFFLSHTIRENRKRRLKMQTVLDELVAQRRRVLTGAFYLFLFMTFRQSKLTTVLRSCRQLYRNTGWWTKVWNTYSDTTFKKTFQITRSTFKFILKRIGSFVVRETITKEPIPPEMRLPVHHNRNGGAGSLHRLLNRT